MMGLAVGIDYSLFVVSRYREERAAGREPDDAIAVAGATASRAVLFSGATVVLALVGMFLVPQTIFRSIAVGAIAVVLVAVLAALTLLPAALAVLGDRIERLRVPGGRGGDGIWSRVAGVALRRPAVSLAAGVAILVALALPYASMTPARPASRPCRRVSRPAPRTSGSRPPSGRRARPRPRSWSRASARPSCARP